MTASAALASEAGSMIDAGGIRTHYHDVGPTDGNPVVMLHGSGPGVSAWANWRLNMDAIAAAGHRVLAPDLVGFGETLRPVDVHYSVTTWARHALDFMDAIGLRRAAIVGNSLGGRIALEMAAHKPARIDRMVLMGTPAASMTMTEGLHKLRTYQPSLENMRRLLLECFAYDPSIVTDDLVCIRHEASTRPGMFETYTEMFSPAHAGNDLSITDETLRGISTRALLIHGLADKVIPVEVSWNTARLLPNADLTVFARCGHWTQIERRADFNAAVTGFLRSFNDRVKPL